MATQLTENFTLEEMVRTYTKLPNKPDQLAAKNLKILCEKVLQPLRDKMQIEILVNSGFRSVLVNNKVNGSPTSQHLLGLAADITSSDNFGLMIALIEGIEFDQLIIEKNYTWLHVSYSGKYNRRQVLFI